MKTKTSETYTLWLSTHQAHQKNGFVLDAVELDAWLTEKSFYTQFPFLPPLSQKTLRHFLSCHWFLFFYIFSVFLSLFLLGKEMPSDCCAGLQWLCRCGWGKTALEGLSFCVRECNYCYHLTWSWLLWKLLWQKREQMRERKRGRENWKLVFPGAFKLQSCALSIPPTQRPRTSGAVVKCCCMYPTSYRKKVLFAAWLCNQEVPIISNGLWLLYSAVVHQVSIMKPLPKVKSVALFALTLLPSNLSRDSNCSVQMHAKWSDEC